MTTNQTIDGVPLLPCPFCGDTPKITKHHREDIYGLIHRCPVAGAISWGFIEDPALHVKRWNRRHVQEQPAPVAVATPVDPERERLMEIVQQYPNVDPLKYDAAVRKLRK